MRKLMASVVGLVSLSLAVLLLSSAAAAGTWTTVPGGNVDYHAVDLVDASHGWVGGVTFIPPGMVGIEDTGIIGRTSTGGSAWQYANSHKSGDTSLGWNFLSVDALDFIDTSRGWAALSDGTIVATQNGGADWTLQAEGSFEMRDNNWGYAGLSMADATHGCAVGGWVGFIGVTKPRIVYTSDGLDWKQAELPDLSNRSLAAVCMVDASYGWAVGSTGSEDQIPLVLATHDGGATWTRQLNGLPSIGISLHGVWFTDRQHGWAVGDYGSIYVTADGGATWWTQSSPTQEKLFAVRFAGQAVGWAVGENGTILTTSNGGLDWATQPSGIKAALRGVAAASGTVWAVGDEGVILGSSVPSGGTPAGVFSDMAASGYGTAIASLAAAGIIGGFPDGTFRPDAPVLRQQFAKMIVLALGIAPSSSTGTQFTDLGSPDADGYPHKYVQAAFDHGITNGTNPAQTLFAPFNPIQRAQVVSMIVRGAKSVLTGLLQGPPAGTPSLFTGVGEPHGQNLRIAEYSGLLKGLTGLGSGWSVSAQATRGEVAQMLYNLRAAGSK